MLFLAQVVRGIDTFSEWTGKTIMWLTTAMVLITVYNVFERYALHSNTAYLIELNWHLYSIIFLLGAAYTLKHDGHVRVDLLYHKLSPRGKAWINMLGCLFFLLPVVFVIVYVSFESNFIGRAWAVSERSPDPGGLPARYLLKTVLPLGFSLLALQGIAEILRNFLFLFGKPDTKGQN